MAMGDEEMARAIAVVVQLTAESTTVGVPSGYREIDGLMADPPVRLVPIDVPPQPVDAENQSGAEAQSVEAIAQTLSPDWEEFTGAIFTVSATSMPTDAFIDMWDDCDDIGLPRAIVITDIDLPGARTEQVIEACQEALGDMVPTLALHLPVLSGDDRPIGLIDLLTADIHDYSGDCVTSAPALAQHLDVVSDERSWLIEAIIAETDDDSLVSDYLAGTPLNADALTDEFYRTVARGRLHPILLTAQSPAGLGREDLQRVIAHGFPSELRSSP
jgi:translation elongation factor EF-G